MRITITSSELEQIISGLGDFLFEVIASEDRDCLGILCYEPDAIAFSVSHALHTRYDGALSFDRAYDLYEAFLSSAQDNLGRLTVLYWPEISIEEQEIAK